MRVITPNIPEAEILLGRKIAGQEELPQVARELSLGRKVSVLLKAGHLHDAELIDVFYNAETDEATPLRSMRLDTPNTHGTGCTLSSAVAAFLAQGLPLDEAVVCAKEYINAQSSPEPNTKSARVTALCTISSTSGNKSGAVHRNGGNIVRSGDIL